MADTASGVIELTESQRVALDVARELIKRGAPVFVARPEVDPDGAWIPDAGVGGYKLPKRWERTHPDPDVVDTWRPGDALCMVTGVVLDVVDIDPRNGGSPDAVDLPLSLGCQDTPSGGSHEFVAPLGVASLDGVVPGIDVKAGLPDGSGRGFVFLAPTRKLSKATGEIAEYEWCTELYLDAIDGQPDESGDKLAAMIRARREVVVPVDAYEGPSYAELSETHRAAADEYVEAVIGRWGERLADAADWTDGEREERLDFRTGGGWESLARDFAYSMAMLAATPWTGLDMATAETRHDELLPEVIAKDPKCAGKFDRAARKASKAAMFDAPPWERDGDDSGPDLGEGLAGLFEATPTLRHIRTAAHARGVSSANVLAWLLAEMLMAAPHDKYLPPKVGSRASLNMGFALVGDSGAGKSASQGVARDLIFDAQFEPEDVLPIGSGEGVVDAFCDWVDMGVEKPKLVLMPTMGAAKIFTVDEGETFQNLITRNGSTLGETIRSGLSGGQLGSTNTKTGGRERRVPGNTYRMLLMINIHPDHGDVLLGGKGVGTPQRFCWMPSADPTMPKDVDDMPDWPGPLDWFLPEMPAGDVSYPDHIVREIKQYRLDQNHGVGDAREGHRGIIQLKVAFALALLHGQAVITDQWWDLARRIMDVSFGVQDMCIERMGSNRMSARVAAVRTEQEAVAAVESDRLLKAATAVVHKLRKSPGETFFWTDVRPAHRLRKGLETSDIIDMLRAQVDVAVEESTDPKSGAVVWKLTYSE